MNKKIMTRLSCAIFLAAFNIGACGAAEVTATNQPAQTQTTQSQTQVTQAETPAVTGLTTTQQGGVIDVKNVSAPTLVAPTVEDTKAESQTVKKSSNSKKIALKAIIFDPNADLKAQAEDEGREMTKLEEAEYNLHDALHCEVKKMDDLSRKGLLNKYLTKKFDNGPVASVNLWGAYIGAFENIWSGSDYKNTLYVPSNKFGVIEVKMRDGRTSFRSMYLFNEGKPGHDFFNDVWGDQYMMYAWSKDKKDQVLVGYSRDNSGIEGGSSPLKLPFFNRSQIARTYGNVRALGIKAQGTHKLYEYNVGAFSSGRAFLDWFPGFEFIASAGVKPLGLTNGKYGDLLIGGTYTVGNAESHYTVENAYIDYEYKRWKATLEYGNADASNGSTGFNFNQSEGFNGTIAYRVTPKLQILGRYDQFDPNKNKANDIRREYTAGINYFLKEQTVKLMVDCTFYSIENGTYGTQLFIGTQIII